MKFKHILIGIGLWLSIAVSAQSTKAMQAILMEPYTIQYNQPDDNLQYLMIIPVAATFCSLNKYGEQWGHDNRDKVAFTGFVTMIGTAVLIETIRHKRKKKKEWIF